MASPIDDRLRLLTSVMIFLNLDSVAGSGFLTEYSYLTARQNICYQEDSVLNLYDTVF